MIVVGRPPDDLKQVGDLLHPIMGGHGGNMPPLDTPSPSPSRKREGK